MEKAPLMVKRIEHNLEIVEKIVKRNGEDGILTGEDTEIMLKTLRLIKTEVSVLSLYIK